MQIDEGYFVCADLSLIAISRNTLTLASSNIIRAAFPDVSNVYDIAIVLKDKIASYADWMEHLAKSSNGLPAR